MWLCAASFKLDHWSSQTPSWFKLARLFIHLSCILNLSVAQMFNITWSQSSISRTLTKKQRKFQGQISYCFHFIFFKPAGHRGLMDSTLGSGDRVCGFKSRSRRSGFFWAFFLLPSSSFPTMWLLSLTMPVGLWIQILRLCTGEAKRELTWKNPSSANCGGETQK